MQEAIDKFNSHLESSLPENDISNLDGWECISDVASHSFYSPEVDDFSVRIEVVHGSLFEIRVYHGTEMVYGPSEHEIEESAEVTAELMMKITEDGRDIKKKQLGELCGGIL